MEVQPHPVHRQVPLIHPIGVRRVVVTAPKERHVRVGNKHRRRRHREDPRRRHRAVIRRHFKGPVRTNRVRLVPIRIPQIRRQTNRPRVPNALRRVEVRARDRIHPADQRPGRIHQVHPRRRPQVRPADHHHGVPTIVRARVVRGDRRRRLRTDGNG